MKKLQLALLALVLGGVFAADADAFFCRKNRCKSRCEKRCERVCPQEDCVTTCQERIESKEGTKCITVEVPVTYTRVCKDYTTTCTKVSSRCDNGCWEEHPCKVKVVCDDGRDLGSYDSNGNKVD
jgi:hypothetical protein